VAVALALAGLIEPRLWIAVPILLGSLIALSHRYYRYFLRQRGWWFVARAFPLHFIYHLYNGLSFAAGTMMYSVARRTGLRMPGVLPLEPWSAAVPIRVPAAAVDVRASAPPARAAVEHDAVGV
jgi:hypothetical protein